MAWCEVRRRSEILGKEVGLNVIVPERGEPPFPVFYLLHGLSDDYSIWHRRSRIEWYVRDLPLIVAMPDGYRGFYTDNEAGPAYASYLGEETVSFVERTFPAKAERGSRCIGGLSMGGYGALRLGLGFADRFVSVNSHSGALLCGHEAVAEDDRRAAEMRRIFGAEPAGSGHDLLRLAGDAAGGRLPALRIDCGTEDFLLEHNRTFHAFLEERGIEHEYAEYPGAHTWDYWDEHIVEALAFHARALGIEPLA